MELEFTLDNDSFLLMLKNLNYGDSKAMKKSDDKKMQQYTLILDYIKQGKIYGLVLQ